MDTFSLLFYTFAFVLVYAGFRVITAKSPVTAALHLVLAFASARASGCSCRPSSSPSPSCSCTWGR